MKTYITKVVLLLAILTSTVACKKNFPSDLDSFSLDMNFTTLVYQPFVGRTTEFAGNFNNGQSSLPLHFKLTNVRTYEGKEAPELLKLFPVKIWKSRYSGLEKSIAEIEAKREIVQRPLWEIEEHSGVLTMHDASNSTLLKTFPDSAYFFDIEVSNNGGRRYFRDLKLVPNKEQATIPYQSESSSAHPSLMLNMVGNLTNKFIRTQDVNVWFNRKGDGNSLTFKFLNPDLSLIPLNKFNLTDWDGLVHGFNKRFADDMTSVTYDLAFPVPLVRTIPTDYTTATGALAFSRFSFDRISSGNFKIVSALELEYAIFQEGDWEIVIYFNDEAPEFEND